MRLRIRRVELGSLMRIGCLVGGVVALLPSLACALLALGLATVARRWLESWQQLTLQVVGQEIARIDLVRFLHLDRLLALLQALTALPAAELLLAVVALALLSGLLLALLLALAGLAYNAIAAATGGVVVEARSLERDGPR